MPLDPDFNTIKYQSSQNKNLSLNKHFFNQYLFNISQVKPHIRKAIPFNRSFFNFKRLFYILPQKPQLVWKKRVKKRE